MPDSPNPRADQSSGAEPSAYERLGLSPDASFDAVQAARQIQLEAAGDDPLARSRVEAAYDAVLMDRLKERQQGRVSTAARSASAREVAPPPPPRQPALTLPRLAVPRVSAGAGWGAPSLALLEGNDRWLVLGGYGLLAGLLLLWSAAPVELLLALATALCLFCLQRRRSRFPAAVGWSFALLSVGLLLGGLLAQLASASLPLGLPLGADQVMGLPALLLLALGALLIA